MTITDILRAAIAASDEHGLNRADLVAVTGLSFRSVEFGLTNLRREGLVPFYVHGRWTRYFAQAQWQAAYASPQAMAARVAQARQADLARRAERKRNLTRARQAERAERSAKEPTAKQSKGAKVGAGSQDAIPAGEVATVPEHVRVQRLPGFVGDVRYAPDLQQAFGLGSFSDEWRRVRAGEGE